MPDNDGCGIRTNEKITICNKLWLKNHYKLLLFYLIKIIVFIN